MAMRFAGVLVGRGEVLGWSGGSHLCVSGLSRLPRAEGAPWGVAHYTDHNYSH